MTASPPHLTRPTKNTRTMTKSTRNMCPRHLNEPLRMIRRNPLRPELCSSLENLVEVMGNQARCSLLYRMSPSKSWRPKPTVHTQGVLCHPTEYSVNDPPMMP